MCDTLGIEHPILAAPMGPDLTGPDLVAAVSNAGGLGILQAQFCTPPVFRQEIRRVRALTAKPFAVNLLLHFPVEDQVAILSGGARLRTLVLLGRPHALCGACSCRRRESLPPGRFRGGG